MILWMELFFLISLSAYSILVYRKCSDFCILILSPANLWKYLSDLRDFWCSSYGVFSSESCVLKTDSFTPSLPIFIPYFSCFNAIAKNASITLSRRERTGHGGLYLILSATWRQKEVYHGLRPTRGKVSEIISQSISWALWFMFITQLHMRYR
jgi:hypothetical protein